MIAGTTIGMLEEGFAAFGKLLDKIPNFEQRKKKEYFKALEELREAKEEFASKTSGDFRSMNSDEVLGLRDNIISKRITVYNLQIAYAKELSA